MSLSVGSWQLWQSKCEQDETGSEQNHISL